MNKIAKLIPNLPSKTRLVPTPFTMAISGGSGGGKSFVAFQIKDYLKQQGYEVLVVAQDDFAIGRGFKNKNTSRYRWDDPENYRMQECISVINDLKNLKEVSFMAYDLINHEPSTAKRIEFKTDLPKIIIFEGILAWYGALEGLADYKLFIEVDFYKRFVLRLFRNVLSIKNIDIDTMIKQYFTHVKQAHFELIEKLKLGADCL